MKKDIFLVVNQIHNKRTQLVEATLWGSDDESGYLSEIIASVVTESHRDPIDKYNGEIGFDLALGRALQALGRKIEKRANGLVKHQDDIRALKEQNSKAAEDKKTEEPHSFWADVKEREFRKAAANIKASLDLEAINVG